MTQNKRTKRRSPITAILAVLLILAGVAAIAGSLWMQENEIAIGAEEYSTLQQELKKPAESEAEIDSTVEEVQSITDELPKKETPAVEEVPSEVQSAVSEQALPDEQQKQPAVTVVPPVVVKPIEPEQQESIIASALTGSTTIFNGNGYDEGWIKEATMRNVTINGQPMTDLKTMKVSVNDYCEAITIE